MMQYIMEEETKISVRIGNSVVDAVLYDNDTQTTTGNGDVTVTLSIK